MVSDSFPIEVVDDVVLKVMQVRPCFCRLFERAVSGVRGPEIAHGTPDIEGRI